MTLYRITAEEAMRSYEKGLPHGSRAAVLGRMLEQEGGISKTLYAPDAVSHKAWSVAATPERIRGDQRDAVDERVGAFNLAKLFSDVRVSVEDAFEGDDRVALRWRMRGIHSGDFACACGAVEATGRPVEFSGINIYRFCEDRIVESWGEVDSAGLEAQSCRDALALGKRRPG
jgi:predicted ester cyclase